MGEAFLLACGLVLLIEGLMPFAAPARWRQVFEQVLRLGDGQIRFIGLCSVLLGLLILGLAGA